MKNTKTKIAGVAPKAAPMTELDIARIVHVEHPATPGDFRVRCIRRDVADVEVVPVTQQIYNAVLGRKHGSDGEFKTLGLRRLVGVYYVFRMLDGVAQGVDIVPQLMRTSGVAPVLSNQAKKTGFEIFHWELCNGYDLRILDKDDNPHRITCQGMTDGTYRRILNAIREDPEAASLTVGAYSIRLTEPGVYRVKPSLAAADEGVSFDVADATVR